MLLPGCRGPGPVAHLHVPAWACVCAPMRPLYLPGSGSECALCVFLYVCLYVFVCVLAHV